MYNTSYFKENDKQILEQFIHDYPLALLTGSFADGQQVATQIPMLLIERDGDWYVQGHVMRNADHHKAISENPQVLAVFTGPQSYVSATWYAEEPMGSTWNYMSVHLRGNARFMSDDELILFMRRFTLHFEGNNSNAMTVFDNLPEAYLSKMLPGIDGFEIKVEDFENVFKLSQNRNKESYINIIEKLKEKGGESLLVAQEMENRFNQIFSIEEK